jgi:hypothetical protein
MTQTIDATFDGQVLRPDTLLALQPNTRVRLTVEVVTSEPTSPSFLRTARELELSGPPDWSENLDGYLNGDGNSAR